MMMTEQTYKAYLEGLKGYKFDGTRESHQAGIKLYEYIKQIPGRKGLYRGNDYRRFKRQRRLGTQMQKKMHYWAELLSYDLINKKVKFDTPPLANALSETTEKKKRPDQRKKKKLTQHPNRKIEK